MPLLRNPFPQQQTRQEIPDPGPSLNSPWEILSSVGGAAWDTFDYSLGVWDDAIAHPFRAVAAGNWEGLKTLIPFHDTLLGMDVKKTSGRDVLEKWGVLGPNQQGLDRGDVAGFAVDVLLDPISFLGTPLKLTKAAEVARRAKNLTKAIDGAEAFYKASKGLDPGALEHAAEATRKLKQLGPVDLGKVNERTWWRANFGLDWELPASRSAEKVAAGIKAPFRKIGEFQLGKSTIGEKFRFLPKNPEMYDVSRFSKTKSTRVLHEAITKNKEFFDKLHPGMTKEEQITLYENLPLEAKYEIVRKNLDSFDRYVQSPGKIVESSKLSPKLQELLNESKDLKVKYNQFKNARAKGPVPLEQLDAVLDASESLAKSMELKNSVIKDLKERFGEDVAGSFDFLEETHKFLLERNQKLGLPEAALSDPFMRYTLHSISYEGNDWLAGLPKKQKDRAYDYFNRLNDTSRSLSVRKARGKDINQINTWARKNGYKGKEEFMETDIWKAAAKKVAQSDTAFFGTVYSDAIFLRHGVTKDLKEKGVKYVRLSDQMWKTNRTGFQDKAWDLGLTKKNSKIAGKIDWKGEGWKEIRKIMGDEDLYVPVEVWKDARKPFEQLSTPKGMKKFFKIYDFVMTPMRGAATVLFPAYFVRNVFGNIWNGSFIGPNKNPIKFYGEAEGLMRRFFTDKASEAEKKLVAKLEDAGSFRPSSVFKQAQNFYQLEAETGFGFLNNPIEWGIKRLGGDEVWDKFARNRPYGHQFVPGGYQFGMIFENQARIALHLSELAKGKTHLEAAASVRKYLFNYEELSAWEKMYGRRAAFFYTFQRKNIPLVIENAFNPSARAWAASVGYTDERDEALPDWVQKSGAWASIVSDKTGIYQTLDLGLPIQDLSRGGLLSRLSPLAQAGLHAAGADINFFTGQPMKEHKTAPNLVNLAADAGLVQNPVMKWITGFNETEGGYRTVHPNLNRFLSYAPGGRVGTIGPKPGESDSKNAVLRILGFGLTERKTSPDRNKLRRAMDILKNRGQAYDFTITGLSK